MTRKTAVSQFECSGCGNVTRKWYGRCPKCGEFGTVSETAAPAGGEHARAGLKSAEAVRPAKKALTIRELSSKPVRRTPSGIGELDRVLGGGFVDAEVILLAGQPGAGKSSLSLAVASNFAEDGKLVLYSSGEESEQQIGLRAQRLGVSSDNIRIVNETSLEVLLGHIEELKPDFLIVDSLQTIASSEIPGSIGSIQQSKEAAHTLTRLAKSTGLTMLLISQIVKSGEFAGSEQVQHIVDATLIFESDNDTPLKFLRATKNRFGSTTEVGVFQHTDSGLEEVSDPAGILLETNDDGVSGSSCSFISEGTRQIPVEIQALVTKSTLPTPRKQFSGVNFQRGQIVCAILDKFCKAALFENDVFVSTVSGVKVLDPQADLSVAASILSSLLGAPIPPEVAFTGELSLTGQIRGSFMVDAKVREAARMGFTTIVVPEVALSRIRLKDSDIRVIDMKTVRELNKFILSGARSR